MNTPTIILRIAALCLLTSALASCGQRGPLYTPGDKPAKKSTGTTIQNAPVKLKAPGDKKAEPDAATPDADTDTDDTTEND